MATTNTGLSSPGVGSGLDVNTIVKQLVAFERRPIASLQQSASRLQTQISGIGQLQSLTSAVRDAAAALSDAGAFTKVNATSSDPAAVAAVATGTPAAGSYSVSAVSLSSGQTTASAASDYLSATDLVGAGTLTITLGRWNEGLTSFTAKTSPAAVDIAVTATDTLATVRDKINAAGAGVTAAIVTDTTGARLTLRSSATGLDSGFRVVANDADGTPTNGTGLSRLAFDPASGTTRTTRTMAANDAVARINGIEVRSATDTFDDVIEGLSLKLSKAPASDVAVSVGANTEAIRHLVTKFVAAYNSLAKFLSAQTSYDPSTQRAGLFQGDSSVVSLSNQLRSIVGSRTMASSEMQGMSSLGIEMLKDGTLQINAARLELALKKLPELAAALTRRTIGQPMLTSSMVRLKEWTDGVLDSAGTLPGRTKSLQSRLSANQRQQEQLEDRVAAVEKRLRAQYTTLDTTLSRANSLNSYVSQQMAALQNANKASS